MSGHRDDLLLFLQNGGAGDDVHANRLIDALVAEVRNEDAALLRERAASYPSRRIFAAGLRHGALMIAKRAVGRDTTPAVEPDFFQPGRTYTENAPFRAPEDRPNFQCVAVAIHPTTGTRRALGFEQPGAGGRWSSSSMRDEEWADGWTDVTEEVTR